MNPKPKTKHQELLFANKNFESPLHHKYDHCEFVVYSHGNIKTYNQNEDSAAVIRINKQHHLLVVADGLGGHYDGAKASSQAVKHLCKQLTDIESPAELHQAIIDSLESVNNTIKRWKTNSGTTIAVAEIFENQVRTYHAGDSEIIICGSRGKLCLQTTAHSPVGYALESGLLAEEDAMIHPDRHYISNYLGNANMHLSIGVFTPLKARDTLLLGTDGLFDNFAKHEIINIIRKGKLMNAAEQLIEIAHKRMVEFDQHVISKPDDMTFILFRL